MNKTVEFQVAQERLGILLAVKLFHDRLPKDFWETLTFEDWKVLTSVQVDQQEDIYELIFTNAVAQTDRVLARVDRMQDLLNLDDHWRWLGVEKYPFHLKILQRRWAISKGQSDWYWCLQLAASILWTGENHQPKAPQAIYDAAAAIQREVAVAWFASASTPDDWYYLFRPRRWGYLDGLSDEERVIVAQNCVNQVPALSAEELVVIYHDLPNKCNERDKIITRLEEIKAWWGVCYLTKPTDQRYKDALGILERSGTYQDWLNGYRLGYDDELKTPFQDHCAEKMIELAPADKLRKLISDLGYNYPRRAELLSKAEALQPSSRKYKRRGRPSQSV